MINFIVFDNFTWRGISCWSKYASATQNKIVYQMSNYELLHLYGFYKNSLSEKISKQISVAVITRNVTFIPANFLRRLLLLVSTFIAAYFVNSIFHFILVGWFTIFSIQLSKNLMKTSGICKALTYSLMKKWGTHYE